MLNDQTSTYWYEIAKRDIQAAIILYQNKGYPETIIYHYHQAIEKLLKGLLLENKCKIIRTHDLERLVMELAKINSKYEEKNILENISGLQTYYPELRYPESFYPNYEDLEEATLIFEKTLDNLGFDRNGERK